MDSQKALDVAKNSYTSLYRLIYILIIFICFNSELILYGVDFSKDYLIVLIFTLLFIPIYPSRFNCIVLGGSGSFQE
jgi:hypothetical protein